MTNEQIPQKLKMFPKQRLLCLRLLETLGVGPRAATGLSPSPTHAAHRGSRPFSCNRGPFLEFWDYLLICTWICLL